MPPKAKLTKEQIAERALDIIRRDGYGMLNARSLAAECGTSTMPLFHYYENMDEIRRAAVALGVELYSRYIDEGMREEMPFKGVGKAYIRFAREEPQLFRAFFMMPSADVAGLSETDPNHARVHDIVTVSLNGDAEGAECLFRDMWIYVHGIATLAVTGKTLFSDEDISRMISHVFASLRSHIMEEENE